MIKLLNILKEINYSLHLNRDNSFDVKKLEKYGGGTDSIIMMRGRGTGHFGSGTYLSTYKNESDYNVDSPKVKDILQKNYGEPLIKLDGGTYAIDLDRYNLYKPKNEKHAELLFNLLKDINDLFYSIESDEDTKIKKEYLTKIIKNSKDLGLKFTKNFVKKIKKEVLPNYSKNKLGGGNLKFKASISTMFMEDNGWNGVNVNGIPMFDNTRHGSVIYDLNDVTDAPKRTPNYYEKSDYNSSVTSAMIKRANEYGFAHVDVTELSNSEINRLLKLIKYNSISFDAYITDFEFMDKYDKIYPNQIEHIKKIYPNIVFKKIKELDFENDKIDDNIYGFVIMYLEKNTNDYDIKYLEYLSRYFYVNRYNVPNNHKSVLNKYLSKIDYDELDEDSQMYYDDLKEDLNI
jgi:hypothetical protein